MRNTRVSEIVGFPSQAAPSPLAAGCHGRNGFGSDIACYALDVLMNRVILVEFDYVLEAALEAAGLLDAWVTPEGRLLAGEQGEPWLDSQWILLRPPSHGTSFTAWLRAAVPAQSPVSSGIVERLLAGVACGADDAVEAWVAPDGRFRLGALTRAWSKPLPVYIGHAARAAARKQRLDEIACPLDDIALEEADVMRQFGQLDADRSTSVFVCENPNLVAIAADRLGPCCAPLVCAEGMPAAARRTLLSQLAQAGAQLRYHGDFDWPGIRIANQVMRACGARPWRFERGDYDAAAARAPRAQRDLDGACVTASWDAALAPAMQGHGLAVPEEALAESLLEDLRQT